MVGFGSIIRLRSGCIITKEGLSMKLKDEDISNIPSFSFIYRFEFYKLPAYPLIRLYFEIFDFSEKDPLKGEVLFDIEKDRDILQKLSLQPLLTFHFFNEKNKYISSKEIPFYSVQRDILENLIDEAQNYLSLVPSKDIDQALTDFFSSFSL